MCGLYGFSNYKGSISKQKLDLLLNCLASESQVRGTQATGIAYNNKKHKLVIQKDSKAADDMNFKIPKDIRSVIGHTRFSTQGSYLQNSNNHPFPGKTKNGKFALCHNGVISNDKMLRIEKNLPKPKVETDSYIAVELLQLQNAINHNTLKEMAETVEGSFVFTILDHNNNLYFVKGDNPLSIIHFEKLGLYVYASTDEILWKALVDSGFIPQIKKGEYTEVPITEGQILSISKDGKLEYSEFEYMDYSYYPRWYNYTDTCTSTKDLDANDLYVEEIKTMASYVGYDDEFVSRMLCQGFTIEEIEDFLYDEMNGFYA